MREIWVMQPRFEKRVGSGPFGMVDQLRFRAGFDFLRLRADTDLTPLGLLEALQNIEHLAGRERPFRNAPRTLDIDILLFEEHRANSLELTLPHPRMLQRGFVLVPLHEIAPHLVTPAQIAAVADQHVSRI
jgi:2-amino-4-hydroxy-6-hydroxymethyldihydropteridine diphosphokinase